MKRLATLVLAVAALAPTLSYATVFTFDLQGKGGSGLLASNENGTVNGAFGSGGEFGPGISYDDVTNLLSIDVAWGSANGFTDLTGAVSAAHLHGPTVSSGTASFNENAGVLFGITSGGFMFSNSASSGFISGTSAALSEVNETALFAGQLYINVHTGTNPGGEIRGNLVNATPVPEPSTYAALAGLSTLALAGLRRRRS